MICYNIIIMIVWRIRYMSYKTFANDFKKGIAGSFLFFHGAEDYLMT